VNDANIYIKKLEKSAHTRRRVPARELGPLTRGGECPHASSVRSHAEKSARTWAPFAWIGLSVFVSYLAKKPF